MLSAEELNQFSQVMAEQLKPIKEEMNERFGRIEARLDKVDARLDKVEARLDKLEEKIDEMAYDAEITRVATNALVKWVEVNFSYKYPFPIEEEKMV